MSASWLDYAVYHSGLYDRTIIEEETERFNSIPRLTNDFELQVAVCRSAREEVVIALLRTNAMIIPRLFVEGGSKYQDSTDCCCCVINGPGDPFSIFHCFKYFMSWSYST